MDILLALLPDDAARRRQPQILPAVLRDGVDAADGKSVGASGKDEAIASEAAQAICPADPDGA